MSVSYSQFQQEVALQVLKFRWYSTVANPTPPAAVNAELNAISTALASDTTTHDETIENPASTAVQFGNLANTDFTDLFLYHVNKGKAGNLSNATMAQAIDGVTGALAPPGVVDVPFLYGVPPYANGSVLTCTQGNWLGTPTTKNYQFRRDGVNFGSNSTTSTYTIVTATDSGHSIDCVVTAINGQGSTIAPASNAIRIP
jgi:hypothetical protein